MQFRMGQEGLPHLIGLRVVLKWVNDILCFLLVPWAMIRIIQRNTSTKTTCNEFVMSSQPNEKVQLLWELKLPNTLP